MNSDNDNFRPINQKIKIDTTILLHIYSIENEIYWNNTLILI